MEINQLLEGSNNYKRLQEDNARLAEKWAQSGLLEGYSNETEKNNMAMILENQAKQIVAEQSSTGTGGSFSAGQGEQWAGVALPLVRKVFAQIAAKDFVSVQPMNLPSGLVFYLDFKYGSSNLDKVANDNMYGNLSSGSNKMSVDEDVSGGLYGVGSYGYSVQTGSLAFTAGNLAAALATGKFTTASVDLDADEQKFGFDTDFSASIAAAGDGAKMVAMTFLSTDFTDGDTDAVRAWKFESTNAADVATVHNEYTTFNPATNTVEILVTAAGASAIDSATAMKVTFLKQPSDNTRGDFEDNPAGSISIPEINVELASEAIVAKTRKLKAQWTPEFAQDLNAYHSVDAEAELTSLLSEYISMEIDLEILDMLINGAVSTERWSAKSNKFWEGVTGLNQGSNAGSWSTKAVADGGYYNTQGQWFQTLGTKIQKVSNKIHQKTLRGGANFLVVSPTVSTILESIPGYAAGDPGDKMDYAFGVQRIGQFNGRYKVYKNPYMTENLILMGYRGSQFLETGAAYCPYIPLMMTPLVYDPNTFTPRKGIMTRYAKKMVRPEFYGKIYISDLGTV